MNEKEAEGCSFKKQTNSNIRIKSFNNEVIYRQFTWFMHFGWHGGDLVLLFEELELDQGHGIDGQGEGEGVGEDLVAPDRLVPVSSRVLAAANVVADQVPAGQHLVGQGWRCSHWKRRKIKGIV